MTEQSKQAGTGQGKQAGTVQDELGKLIRDAGEVIAAAEAKALELEHDAAGRIASVRAMLANVINEFKFWGG